jgi:D-tyrosyl-tRNA(Tyr) deacylase
VKAVVQRANHGYVDIDGDRVAEIGKGLVVLLGVEKEDERKGCEFLARKVCNLRIFKDENDKMSNSVKDIDGEVIIVSQFTLAGKCNKGNRPDFTGAMQPDVANDYYEYFVECCKKELGDDKVQTGRFAASMKVGLENDGPVTILLEY